MEEKVVLTKTAKSKLREIYDFYCENSKEGTANQIVRLLTEAILLLSQFPKIGQYEPLLEEMNLGHRRYVKGYFKIIYKIENDIIYITDIDTRQDPSKINP